jgi:thiamine pyrophosphokinase
VGDWDSLKNSKKILKGRVHLTLPTSKDRSDLFFAILAAIEAGAQEIVCVGVTGERPDHHFAMLSDLSIFSTGVYGEVKSIEARGTEADYFFLSEKIPQWRGRLTQGQMISLFSMSEIATGVSLSGFQYPLKNAKLTPSSRGLSNCALQGDCRVRVRRGRMLLIVPRGSGRP